MENNVLTLDSNKSFSSVNKIKNIGIDLESEEKLLPVSDLQGSIDAYEQYLKEKDMCNKYRIIFTIRPYCSNILFNHITEAVYHEGSDFTRMILREEETKSGKNFNLKYSAIKDVASFDGSPITRDTGYSSNSNSDEYLNYNCGIDIFNNHLLRRKEFVCVNKILKSSDKKLYFNTLFDEVRDPWGEVTSGFTYNISNGESDKMDNPLHLYNKDSIYSFKDSIAKNLIDENGWVGFKNTAILDTINVSGFPKINCVLNNVEACSFVDMYPTRKHYSFVPYFNNYRKRIEKNWEYLLTYPYMNAYNHEIVYDNIRKIDGLKCDLIFPEVNGEEITIKQLLGKDDNNPVNVPLNVTFHSHVKHSLKEGDKIALHVFNHNDNNKNVYTNDAAVVTSIGNNGYDSEHYFSLNLNEILTDITLAYNINNSGAIGFRFEKMGLQKPCRYYFRVFKKIPNFANTKINVKDGITEEEINEALTTNDFTTSLNKLGFSKTIYGDDIAQIIYDDVTLDGLRDNLGRELSVIYLTIVKTNYGHIEWYENKNYTESTVEYSHCFGNVTSGFDLPSIASDVKECNVHKQHNITKQINDVPTSSYKLEPNITVRDNFEFFGDLVELNEETLEETVLENVQHRFNTAQREFDFGNTKEDNPFAKLIIDDISNDDYSNTSGFSGKTEDAMCTGYWANIAPEGYYYQTHYPIRIKEYDTTVNTGYHTKINFISFTGTTMTTDVNYYLETNQEIYLFNKDTSDNTRYIGYVKSVSGDDFRTIGLALPDNGLTLDDYIMFKPNVLKPDSAYDFGAVQQPKFVEKTGRYIWRDILPSSKIPRSSELYDSIFTNNAIYLYKDINFYLKRQDPYGEYGLRPTYDGSSTSSSTCIKPYDIEFVGNETDISYGDYFEPGENNVC